MSDESSKNFFNNKIYKFKIERLNKISERNNINLGVYKYKISYISINSNEILREIFMVGKTVVFKFPNFNYNDGEIRFQKYFSIAKLLKELKFINYSFRRFPENLNNVETINFNKEELYRILFLKDLDLIGEVLPINKREFFNKKIVKKIGEEIWLEIFEKILLESKELFEKGLIMKHLDIWMVIINPDKNNGHRFNLEIVDLDTFTKFDNNIKQYEEFFENVSIALKPIINSKNKDKYIKIIKKCFDEYLDEKGIELIYKRKIFRDKYIVKWKNKMANSRTLNNIIRNIFLK